MASASCEPAAGATPRALLLLQLQLQLLLLLALCAGGSSAQGGDARSAAAVAPGGREAADEEGRRMWGGAGARRRRSEPSTTAAGPIGTTGVELPTDVCTITDGTRCVFPFMYRGVSYENCTDVDDTKDWCATETDPSGGFLSGAWDYCADNCKVPTPSPTPAPPTPEPAPAAQPTPVPIPVVEGCKDDDNAACAFGIAYAYLGLSNILRCSDVAHLCWFWFGSINVGKIVRDACPLTCCECVPPAKCYTELANTAKGDSLCSEAASASTSGSRLQVTTTPASGIVAALEAHCTTLPPGWVDSEGYACESYGSERWCDSTGGYGDGWVSSWGTFGDYAGDGATAPEACCECGGGSAGAPMGPEECADFCMEKGASYFQFHDDTSSADCCECFDACTLDRAAGEYDGQVSVYTLRDCYPPTPTLTLAVGTTLAHGATLADGTTPHAAATHAASTTAEASTTSPHSGTTLHAGTALAADTTLADGTTLVDGTTLQLPTGAPTPAPADAPSSAPTDARSPAPTAAPSPAPMGAPTPAPTDAPTSALTSPQVFVVKNSLSFASSGTRQEVAGAVTAHLASKHGVGESTITAAVSQYAGRRLQAGYSWQVDYEVRAMSQQAAQHALEVAQSMSAGPASAAAEMAATFAARGLALDEQTLAMAVPTMEAVSAGQTTTAVATTAVAFTAAATTAAATTAAASAAAVDVASASPDDGYAEASGTGTMIGIAIAAVVVLGLAAGAAMLMRSRKASGNEADNITCNGNGKVPDVGYI